MNHEERFLHLYETNAEFEADYNGSVYHEDWVSYTEATDEVHYNKDLEMSVQELIDAGYAEVKQDRSRQLPGSEQNFNVIQIHSNCPVTLENITDFDDYLESSATFVWREELPAGWKPGDLAEKYNNATLVRPISPEMFPCVDMSGVDELSLSFAGGGWQYTHSSIVTERYKDNGNYYPDSKFKTPKHLTVTIRDDYGSVAQTNFSMLKTTTGITINCGVFSCHDVTGMFESNPELVSLVINGSFRWDGWRICHLVFDGDDKLESIPYVVDWGRTSVYNTIYPRYDGTRGSANCGGIFNATGLTSIGPVINMNAVNLSGATVDGYSQSSLPYANKPMFNCPVLTDVRIINLNNNDWNFADGSTYTKIPQMDVASIEYLLNNVADCTANPHTVTFSTLHQNDVSASAISAAAEKGWTVVWQAAE